MKIRNLVESSPRCLRVGPFELPPVAGFEPITDLVITGPHAQALVSLVIALHGGQRPLLVSPPGLGKTALSTAVGRLLGRRVIRIVTTLASVEALVGSYVPKKSGRGFEWRDSLLVTAMRSPGDVLVILDELCSASNIGRLVGVLEQPATLTLIEHDGELIESASFTTISTANDPRRIAPALLDRHVITPLPPNRASDWLEMACGLIHGDPTYPEIDGERFQSTCTANPTYASLRPLSRASLESLAHVASIADATLAAACQPAGRVIAGAPSGPRKFLRALRHAATLASFGVAVSDAFARGVVATYASSLESEVERTAMETALAAHGIAVATRRCPIGRPAIVVDAAHDVRATIAVISTLRGADEARVRATLATLPAAVVINGLSVDEAEDAVRTLEDSGAATARVVMS